MESSTPAYYSFCAAAAVVEDASSMDYYVFRKVLMSSILLAGPELPYPC